MTGCYPEDRLYDFVDGNLEPAECESIERHLRDCPACRRAVDEMRSLADEVAALARETEPERDLWPEIAPRLRGSSSVVRPAFGSKPRRSAAAPRMRTGWIVTAAAAFALAALALGILLSDPTGAPLGGSDDPLTIRPERAVLARYDFASSKYEGAVEELVQALELRRDELAPETIAEVERSLAIIDDAIAKARAALEKDASHRAAGRLYASMYQRKIDLLRWANSLPSDG